jgi:hypothetical protein
MSDTAATEPARTPTHAAEVLPRVESQEGTGIAMGKIVAVGILSILVFAIGSWWAYRILETTTREMNPSGHAYIPAAIGQEEINIVDQVPFELNRWVSRYDEEYVNEKGTGRLQTYGWTDRKTGTIRIPIDRAMDLIVEEQQK